MTENPHDDVDLPSEAEQFLRWNTRVQDVNGNILYNQEVKDKYLKARKIWKVEEVDNKGNKKMVIPEVDTSGAACLYRFR